MEAPIYREEVWLAQWASIALGIFIAILTPLFILQLYTVSKEPTLTILYLVLDIFFVSVFVNFRKLDIVITNTWLTVSFGLIRKKITLSNLVACEPVQAKLGVYSGFGIRYGGDGSLAFLTSLSDAVRLELVSGRPFVFSTRNQRKIMDIIRKLT